ncbi:hypothetical protein [Micromonospora sp. RP3T]|uniref:hypothetical protein n=1 Tax=Micromonospora sp. RP3T TaxID=2135446 RepID=UPI003D738BBF
MDEGRRNRWPGVSCESDAWPFSPDIAVFEARRAVGQLARTLGDGLDPPGLDRLDVDPVLRYIYAVDVLEATLARVREDLVAEARARGVAWAKIGCALGVGDTAAQKRFRDGLRDGRLEELTVEAMTCWIARQAATPHQLREEVATELAGVTPLERLEYLARNALGSLREIDDLLALAGSEPATALDVLRSACGRIERVARSVIADHEMWDAMADWAGRARTVDQTNYHASTAYLLHAMRLLVFALLHAPDAESGNVDQFRRFLAEIRRVYATVLLIFERFDVGSAVPSPEAADAGLG